MSIETSVARVAGHIQNQTDLIEQIKAGLTEAEENMGRTNNEISTQSDIIQQIKTALEDKAAGGGGVELPTLANEGSAEDLVEGMQLIDQNGNPVTGTMEWIRPYFSNPTLYVDKSESEFVIELNNTKRGYIGSNARVAVESELVGDATADDVSEYATFTSKNGVKIPGNLKTLGSNANYHLMHTDEHSVDWDDEEYVVCITHPAKEDTLIRKGCKVRSWVGCSEFGNAKPSDVREGVTFTSAEGLLVEGKALIPGGGFVYPDGAFAPVSNFTAGKQYALVSVVEGVSRYLNSTSRNTYTMRATEVSIEEHDSYVTFSATPSLFTAVASGDGFLLQNGSNYLNGTSSGGTTLVLSGTQMVWTAENSANGGFSEKYLEKEDANAVWLINNSGGYRWCLKHEVDNNQSNPELVYGFGYDRAGRDNTYSAGFVSVVLYEYVAGEGELNPVVDSSDANVTADKMLAGYSGYANGKKVDGNIQSKGVATITPSTTEQYIEPGVYLEGRQTISAIQTETKTVTANGTVTPSAGKYLTSVVVNVPTGGTSTGGLVVKSGTTTSATIETGLSSIEEFFIYKETQTATGLIRLHYSKTGGTSYMYASAWSTNTYGTKTITNATTAPTISGGSITLPSSTATSGGLSSGVTYKWTAIGTE